MESRTLKELSNYRLEKAKANLEISKSLFQESCYGFSLNRAYYAVFDAIRAVNALDGFDSSKHSGVIAHFNKEYVKLGIFPASVSSVIRKASMLREKSDYEDFFDPSEEETSDTIYEVEKFISMVVDYLKAKR